MPQLLINLRLIWEDIKHSWYFRVWAFLWLFCVVFTFAVLILLGQASTQAQLEPTFHFWAENASSLHFPSFRFFDPINQFENEVQCVHNGKLLQTVACAPRHDGKIIDITHCQAVIAHNEVAENTWGDWRERAIHCNFSCNEKTNPNQLVSFEIEGEFARFGPSHGVLWFGPNNNTWILLDKSTIKFRGRERMVEWERDLVYHSTVHTPGFYRVALIINRFFVNHVDEGYKYDGWRALGEIGGFAYFLLLLHAFMMILVGICLNNNAKSLVGDTDPSGGYAALGSNEERTGML